VNVKGDYTHIHSRDSSDTALKAFYIRYCKIINTIIEEAKKYHYNRLTASYDDKIKTKWKIISRRL
jgi:hypothetical protein